MSLVCNNTPPEPSPMASPQALARLSLLGPLNDGTLRAFWRACGGEFHGPHIETGTMPESMLLPFLRDFAAAVALEARAACQRESHCAVVPAPETSQ